ncbi:MAG: hypothetical protein ACREAR_03935 [Nitrosotalea sp.]
MSKEVPRGTNATTLKLEECPDCKTKLIHDYYSRNEATEKGMDLNFDKQRNSYCSKCKTLYVNSK